MPRFHRKTGRGHVGWCLVWSECGAAGSGRASSQTFTVREQPWHITLQV